MTVPASRVSAALVAILAAAVSQIAVEFVIAWLVGAPTHVFNILAGSVWLIIGLSILAGAVRLPFARGGYVLSAVFGALVAVGYAIFFIHTLAYNRF